MPPSSPAPTCCSSPPPNSCSISVGRSPRAAWPAGSTTTQHADCSASTRLVTLSYDTRAADLLFQVVSRRYEKKSLVLTTNLAFGDWPTIFPNAGSAIALIDRLVHHAEIIAIEGESYRRRVAEAKRKPRPPAGT